MKRIFILFFTISVFLSLVLSSCTTPNVDLDEDITPQIQDESEVHSESVFDGEGDDEQKIRNVQENKEEIECDNQQKIEDDENETDEPESIEADEREYSDSGHLLMGEGTYEYKGVTFEGIYKSGKFSDGREYHSFYINHDSLYHGEGRSLYDATLNFTLAYIDGDAEKMTKYFYDNEKYKKYIEDPTLLNRSKSNFLEYMESIKLHGASTKVGGEYISVIFSVIIFKDGWHTGIDVCMSMILNDEGEWKVSHYDGC